MPISLKTELHKGAGLVPFTNSTGNTITAGTPVLAGGRLAIALRDIANGDSDEVLVDGRVRGVKANEAWAVGDLVGWDSNGNPAVLFRRVSSSRAAVAEPQRRSGNCGHPKVSGHQPRET